MLKVQALGLIEVTGYLGAIAAADAALKAANVTLLRSEKIKGGFTTVELIGDVAAIQAAVDAGKVVAEKLNCLRAGHVIARMDGATANLLAKEETVTVIESEMSAVPDQKDSPLKETSVKEVKGETDKKNKKE